MYNGFVYIWYDKHTKMFYIGSHYGQIDDGYIGSGIWFISAYNKRPASFKRKILELVIGDYKQIQLREQAWLDKIKTHELETKYYNLKKFASGGSTAGKKRKSRKPTTEKTKKLMSKSHSNKPPKDESHRSNLSKSVAKIYTFVNQNTHETYIGSVREFAIKYYTLGLRGKIAQWVWRKSTFEHWLVA